jgi:hypothetical protein
MDELIDRLEMANAKLIAMADRERIGQERLRLLAKAEGVRLAQSCAEEQIRLDRHS